MANTTDPVPGKELFKANSISKSLLLKRIRSLSRLLALFSMVFPLMGAAGWIFNIPILTHGHPSLPEIQPNTIFGLVLSALAILLSREESRSSRRSLFIYLSATFVLLLGLLSLSEYMFGWNIGIDHIFTQRVPTVHQPFPGRPSPQASLNFLLLGFALLSFNLRFITIYIGQTCTILVGLNTVIAVTGYIFSVSHFYGFPFYAPAVGMAILTSMGFIFLAVALLLSHPTEGIMSLVSSDTQSGSIARKILLSGIVSPPLVGALTKIGVIAGWYTIGTQVSLFAIVIVGLILRTTWHATKQAEKEELLARAAAEATNRTNEQLQRAIDERQIFAALVENSSDFIGIADANGNPTYLNQAGRRMVGLSTDYPIENTQILEYYSPDQRAFASDVIVKTMSEKGQWRGETYFRNWKTEEAIPVSDEHFLIRDPKSECILGMGTITHDITEQKRIEKELRFFADVSSVLASTLNYENTLDNIVRVAVRDIADLCVVYTLEQNGKISRSKAVSRDPAKAWVCDLLMRTPFSHAPQNPVDLVIKTKRSILIEHMSPDMIESIAHSEEHLKALRAVELKSFMISPLLVHGKLIGAINLVSSVTSPAYGPNDLRLAEELAQRAAVAIENAQLYREAQRAKLITDNLPAMIAYWDKDQNCLFANQAVMEWFEVTPEKLVGLTLKELLGSTLYEMNLPYINGALSGVKQSFERDLKSKSSGMIRHTTTTYIPDIVYDKVLGFFVLVSDVTDLKEAQLMALSESEKALAAVKTREEVLAIVSHDLKNPLASVSLVTQLLQRLNQVDLEKVHEYANRIQRSVDLMQRLIGDLLDFSKIQSGTFSIDKFRENPMDVILTAADGVRLLAEAKRQHLEIEISKTLPTIVACDANRIGQVLSNLLGNAIKFTPEGGTIRLIATERKDGVLVSVCDTGPGIPTEQLPKIFDRFWQAAETKKLGSGLGLAIAKGIIEAHGTRIWAESEVGKGSCFFFTIPWATTETKKKENTSLSISEQLFKFNNPPPANS